jgi:outer membrane immunogenic protein
MFAGSFDSHVRWFDTLTGRAGWLAQPNLLLYAQGGAAWTQATFTFNDPTGLNVGEVSRNKSGWTVGGGVEWMFVPHWSVFVEYNFLGFGTNSSSVIACGGACILSGKADLQNVLVGLNYKF